MLADGLAQYLIWKQWRDWVLLYGSHERDQLSPTRCGAPPPASAARSSPRRSSRTPARRGAPDSGVVQIQRQLPVFMQDLPDHDVVLVADESEVFGTYVPFRTWIPRPVAGTAGLMPIGLASGQRAMGRHADPEPFRQGQGRRMALSKDTPAWTAARIIGTRQRAFVGRRPAKQIEAFILADDFSIAAFKGQKLIFRKWNRQLRQPIFIGDRPAGSVSTSPQEGFLHQFSELDTLGVDKPETKCVLK